MIDATALVENGGHKADVLKKEITAFGTGASGEENSYRKHIWRWRKEYVKRVHACLAGLMSGKLMIASSVA